jgi:hypothetical protein
VFSLFSVSFFFSSTSNPDTLLLPSLPSIPLPLLPDTPHSHSTVPSADMVLAFDSSSSSLSATSNSDANFYQLPSQQQPQHHDSSSSHFHLEALGSLGIIITGKSSGNELGFSVAIGGDVNSDSYGDMIIGAPSYNSDSGQVYLIYGGLSLTSIALATSFTSTQGITISAPSTGYGLGTSVDVGGDVNGDGKNDFMIGAPSYNTNTGIAYVLYGSASLPTNFALSSLSSSQGISITGPSTNYYAGCSVSLGVDIIPDGKRDPLFGGYGYSTNTGRAWYLTGSSSLSNVAVSGLASSQRLTGTASLVVVYCPFFLLLL